MPNRKQLKLPLSTEHSSGAPSSIPSNAPSSIPLEPLLDLSKAANTSILPKQENDKKQQLWLCLYFPKISLETVTTLNDETAQVVIDEQSNGLVVHTPCYTAMKYGITKNMPLNAAYALCPELKILHRNKENEIINISKIANWSQNFTSHVNIVSTEKILLEIKGSLLLFRGLSSILKIIENSFSSAWPYHCHIAISPTPLASQILCEFNKKTVLKDHETLRPVIASMPIDCLPGINARQKNKIKKSGIKTIQDLLRLPRDGLARRFTPMLLKSLDQLTGSAADPRVIYKEPLEFNQSIELAMETSNGKIINYAANSLIQKLSTFLIKHDRGVSQLHIVLKHLHHSTKVVLHLRQMSRTASHISNLFIEKMERTKLNAPVIEVSLVVNEILPFITCNQALFPGLDSINKSKKNSTDSDWENTLEQLQNRLGPNAVKYFNALDDIHPEFAWCHPSTPPVIQHDGTSKRPLWLLNTAKPLQLKQNKPFYHGVLSLIHEPERIQTGWWRGENQQISRDYYIALSPNMGYLWIYRDLKQKSRWYLHGFLG